METEIEKQIDELIKKALEKSSDAQAQAAAEAIDSVMRDDDNLVAAIVNSKYRRALEELLEAIELAWEWVTNEQGERVRVLNVSHPNFVSAKREAYAVLGKKVSR